MTSRRTLLKSATALAALSLIAPTLARSAEPIRVVATFSILGDMVQRIGGGRISVTTLVGPGGDTHVYQPTPADARSLDEAEVLFVNGLEFEGWIDRLVEASGFAGQRVVATEGVDAIALEESDDHGGDEHHDDKESAEEKGHGDKEHAEADEHGHHHGEFDPHAWQSLANGKIYAGNIAKALAKADPSNAASFRANAEAYIAEMQVLDGEIRHLFASIPADRKTVVTSHDAFQYFGRDYGLAFLAPQGLSTEAEASAKDVAHLIQQIREKNIKAVFVENVADPRLLERIAQETGTRIGGRLYPGALSGPDGPAATYLDMMRHNAMTLAQALSA